MQRILIGEPSLEIHELLERVVSGLGLEAVPVDGRDASSLPKVDALLLEPGLPGGVELAQRLRERTPGLPIVCVSIYPASPEVIALEPVAYLVKPFALLALQAAIGEAVSRRSVPA